MGSSLAYRAPVHDALVRVLRHPFWSAVHACQPCRADQNGVRRRAARAETAGTVDHGRGAPRGGGGVTTTDYRLTDRFTADRGTVFLSGIQALARLPTAHPRPARRPAPRPPPLVTGSPGPPLGGFDVTVRQAAKLASDLPIV